MNLAEERILKCRRKFWIKDLKPNLYTVHPDFADGEYKVK